jgi:prepilin-type processing-associated H-X9-DG protein
VALLPYLEQATLSDSLDCWVPITSPSVASARETSLGIMLCPSDIAEPSFALYVEEEDADNARHALSRSTRASSLIAHLPTANYLGVFGTIEPDDTFPAPAGDGVFVAHQAVRFDDLRRGLSRTLVVGERTMAMVPSTWLGISFRGEDAACRLVGSAITTPNCDPCDECEFSSRHAGGANFLWADGHVGLIPKQTDSAEYRRLARRALSLSEPPKGSVLWKRAN